MPTGKELIGYCGLYCGDCYMYKGKIADLARDLRKELRQEKFNERAAIMAESQFFAAFKDYPQCYDLLGQMVKFRCKRTCGGGGGIPVCKVRDCCRKKDIKSCWQCAEFETCQKLAFLKTFHGDAHIKNLKTLKKSGIDSYMNGKRYW